jgi:hypothetical protein
MRKDTAMHWLNELELDEKAAAVRRTLAPTEFVRLQVAIEHLSLVTSRPVVEVANRLLASVGGMVEGDGPDPFLSLINDIIEENER